MLSVWSAWTDINDCPGSAFLRKALETGTQERPLARYCQYDRLKLSSVFFLGF